MKKHTGIFSLCLVATAWMGLQIGQATFRQSASPTAMAASLAAPACTANATNVKIQKLSGGNNFAVSWEAPSPCQRTFDVELTVTKLSGATRTDRKRVENRVLAAAFSFIGDGDLNPIKSARATVTATGILAAKATLTKNLGIGAGTGSNGPAPAATPTPTFQLFGTIRNRDTGDPISQAQISFEILNNGPRIAIQPVETDNQGRWKQSGFPVGTKVRVTAFRRFLTMEPATRVVTEGGELKFVARLPDQGKPAPTATPLPTFTAKGRAVVNSLSQNTQTGLSGATISFKVLNTKSTQANVPGPVTTQKDGGWSQSGFTVGVLYQATISKTGVAFSLPTANFTSSNPGTIDDVGFLGTVK